MVRVTLLCAAGTSNQLPDLLSLKLLTRLKWEITTALLYQRKAVAPSKWHTYFSFPTKRFDKYFFSFYWNKKLWQGCIKA